METINVGGGWKDAKEKWRKQKKKKSKDVKKERKSGRYGRIKNCTEDSGLGLCTAFDDSQTPNICSLIISLRHMPTGAEEAAEELDVHYL